MFPLKDNIPTDRPAVITMVFIALNVFVYFVLQRGGWTVTDGGLVTSWGAIPYELWHYGRECELDSTGAQVLCEGQAGVSGEPESQPPAFVTAISSIFLHGSILHLAGNMLFLWIFGNNIEDAMGRVKFVAFYFIGGFAALAAQVLIDPEATAPMVGASGAVAGVLGAYAAIYPRARVVTLIFIVIIFTVIELPAFLMLGLWFAQQIALGAAELSGPLSQEGGGVAYFAHIGGFVAGAVLIKLFATNIKPVPPRVPVGSMP
ncbi:rhomboid family intramembrane serine protease [Svornostia abyssi]|uniref:Rhomboid family intramembrane serine protease n=1 Tax=Svornostia abyssi TaxID=2898438 RepID=A0ABY5PJQ1_9ACTN|nr:rhomboid family intramembrane serine protease [Parviterribacteraceae bacterium J379]